MNIRQEIIISSTARSSGTTISYSIPLSILANDEGDMDLLAVSGDMNAGATETGLRMKVMQQYTMMPRG